MIKILNHAAPVADRHCRARFSRKSRDITWQSGLDCSSIVVPGLWNGLSFANGCWNLGSKLEAFSIFPAHTKEPCPNRVCQHSAQALLMSLLQLHDPVDRGRQFFAGNLSERNRFAISPLTTVAASRRCFRLQHVTSSPGALRTYFGRHFCPASA